MSERARIVSGFAAISLIWGSTWLAIKIGLDSLPPLYAVSIRFTVAAAILLVILRVRRIPVPVDRRSVLLYLNLAVLSFSFPYALVYWSEQYIPSALASILFAAYPFVVAVGSHLFLPAERLNRYKIAGIASGFLGVILIFWTDLQLEGANTPGMVAILVSTLLQGSSLVLVKRAHPDINPNALTFGGMVAGLLILYPLALIFESPGQVHLDAKGAGTIVYLGSFGTVVTFVIYYWLLKRVQAVYLSLVSLVTPVIAVILGALWLNEALSPRVFFGAALVLCGIALANGGEIGVLVGGMKKKILSQSNE